jgi:SWI/SNF-related matrix-associated actin-dependent regulator 1 of chromatin subfamily A
MQAIGASVALAVDSADERATAVDATLQARGLALYSYQRAGLQWLASRRGALLCDDMGLGKTIQTIVAIPDGARVVIVCPAVLKGNWAKELGLWRPELRTTILEGENSYRAPVAGEVVILNYNILPTTVDASSEGIILIADEAHAIKGKSQRTTRFRALAKGAARVWLLTATPILNRPPELWCLFTNAGIAKEAFGTYEIFVRAFGGTHTGYNGAIEYHRPPTPDAARLMGRVSLRRMKSEVLADLPPKTRQEVTVDISAALRRKADKALLLPLSFENLAEIREALARAKGEKLGELLAEYEAANEPVLVFSAHRAPIDALAKREGWAVITGSEKNAERFEIAERFQRGELKGLGITIQAGGSGLTLTRASNSIFVDSMWTPKLNEQAEDRIHRIGTKNACLITYLVCDHPLDRRIADVCAGKTALVAATVDQVSDTPAELASAPVASELPVASPAAQREVWAQEKVERAAAIEATRREAKDDREAHAALAIEQLTGNNSDRATIRNEVGWNRLDGEYGAELCAKLPRLTDVEWDRACKIVRKYHGQVGVWNEAAE